MNGSRTKFLLTKCALLALTSTALSAHAGFTNVSCSNPYLCSMSGFYAGLSGGMDVNSVHNHITVQGATNRTGTFVTQAAMNASNNLYYVQPIIGAQVGYRYPIQRIYSLGAELFGQRNFNKATTNFQETVSFPITVNNTVTYNTEMRYVYGLRLLPGIALGTNALLYGILGVGVAQFENNLDVSYAFNLRVFPTFGFGGSSHRNKNKTSGQIGAGIEFAAAEHIGVGARYVYSYYGQISNPTISALRQSFFNNRSVFSSADVRRTISNHEVALELNYYFC